MGKHEGRAFLDKLVELRATYQTTAHTATSTTVSEAIAHAIDLMDHPERLDALLTDGSTGSHTQLHPA